MVCLNLLVTYGLRTMRKSAKRKTRSHTPPSPFLGELFNTAASLTKCLVDNR